MSLIDIILLAILLLFAIAGAVTGFFKTVAHFAVYIVSAVVSGKFSAPLAAILYNKFVSAGMREGLRSRLPDALVNTDFAGAYQAMLESLPQKIVKIADFLHLLPAQESVQSISSALTVESMEQSLIMPVVTKILALVVGIVLFLVVSILLRLIVTLINKRFFEKKHSKLSSANRVLGFLTGLVKGALPAAALCALMLLIIPLTGNEALQTALSDSVICSFATRYIL